MAKGGIMMQNDPDLRNIQAVALPSTDTKPETRQNCQSLKLTSVALPIMLNNRCGVATLLDYSTFIYIFVSSFSLLIIVFYFSPKAAKNLPSPSLSIKSSIGKSTTYCSSPIIQFPSSCPKSLPSESLPNLDTPRKWSSSTVGIEENENSKYSAILQKCKLLSDGNRPQTIYYCYVFLY